MTFVWVSSEVVPAPGLKLEVMMMDLDQDLVKVFHQDVSIDGPDARKVKHFLEHIIVLDAEVRH